MARELLARGAAVDAAGNKGWMPLLVASGNLEVVQELLRWGAAVDGAFGNTPLLAAVKFGRLHVVEALVAGGAALNVYGYRAIAATSPSYRSSAPP